MRFATAAEPLPVLVVDDDSALIRTLSDILRMHGYAPETAVTGREGLAKARHTSPALAVVDLRLPDMDGMELAAKLHALSELTEVVVLTGNASVESAVAALREHSVDYLLKPVNVERFLQVASVATERWQRRHAEERLRESDERFRRVVESDMLGIVFWRGDGSIEDANDAFLKIVGYSRADLLAGVLERKSDGQSLLLRAGVGWGAAQLGQMTTATGDDTQAGYTLARNEPTIVTDMMAERRFSSAQKLRDHGIQSGITVVIPGPAH